MFKKNTNKNGQKIPKIKMKTENIFKKSNSKY